MCIGTILIGVLCAGMYPQLQSSIVPESELILAEGVPEEVRVDVLKLRRGAESHYLYFRLGRFLAYYDGRSPHYREVLDAVKSGESVQIWIPPSGKGPRSDGGSAPIYKMTVLTKPVVNYDEVVSHETEGNASSLVVGGAIVFLGFLGLIVGFGYKWRYNRWMKAQAGGHKG